MKPVWRCATANYLHYTEHTRHLFLKHCGLSFAEMHEKGVDAVVARMNLQYKTPLRCDDEFISRLWLEKQGIKYVFHQDIFRASDEAMCFRGDITLVCLVNGRLSDSEASTWMERYWTPWAIWQHLSTMR